MNETKRKIIEYLAERDIWIRDKTGFETQPCYLCQEFDPWLDISGTPAPDYDYVYNHRPCDHRMNYCRTFDKLCKLYKEAGKTFWSAERWRIENKEEFGFMNANMWRKHKPADESIIVCGELRK